jgi:Protein of unknown function (DUF2510)
MSDLHAAPAGWYPEPSGTEGQRWWDGMRWTEYATPLSPPRYAPYGSPTEARVREGTPVDTVWIWLIVALPLVSLLPFFLIDFEGYVLESMTDPTAQLRLYLDPMYLATVAIAWIAYGAGVWFAYLDVVALRKLGYARQFHWAWAFLSLFVYVIGRSVVAKRQAGRGSAPMWVAIALGVALMIGSIVWAIVIVMDVMSTAMLMYPVV